MEDENALLSKYKGPRYDPETGYGAGFMKKPEDSAVSPPQRFASEDENALLSKYKGPRYDPETGYGAGFMKKPEVAAETPSVDSRIERMKQSPVATQALAGIGSGLDTLTLGIAPWLAAAGSKVINSDRHKDQDIKDIKRDIDKEIEAARSLYPKTGFVGDVGGVVGGFVAKAPVFAAKAATTGLGKIASLASAGAKTGAAYGAVQGFTKDLDVLDAIGGATVGAVVGGAASPVVERVAGGITKLFTGGNKVVDSLGNLSPAALSIARKAGLADDEISALGQNLINKFKERGLTEQAAKEARFSEFGIEPTRGMVSGDKEQLLRESKYGAPSYERIKEQAATTAGLKYGEDRTVRDAVGEAVEAIGQKATASQRAYQKAYEDARSVTGEFDQKYLTNLGEKIRNDLAKEPKNLDIYHNGVAIEAANKLDDILAKPIGEKGNIYTNFDAVESARKSLNELFSKTTSTNDRRALMEIISRFDDKIEGGINSGLFTGDASALTKWKDARRLYSDYQSKFGIKKTGEDAGSLVKSIISENRSHDDIARMIFNFSDSGDAKIRDTALKTLNQLRRALGASSIKSSPELMAVKDSFLKQMMLPTSPDVGGFSKTAQNIRSFIQGRGQNVSNELLTDAEKTALSRYAKVMEIAGTKSKEDLGKEISKLRTFLGLTAPSVASGASWILGYSHPVVAGVAGGLGTIYQGIKAVKKLPYYQAREANKPISGNITGTQMPGVRAAVPMSEDLRNEMQSRGGRIQRASGGRAGMNHVTRAAMLIRAAERAKNQHGDNTESLLNQPDESIAKALKVANSAI